MTDINITYEDGLRLSELMGDYSKLQFEMDNLWAINALDIAIMIMLIMLGAITVGLIGVILLDLHYSYMDKPCYLEEHYGKFYLYKVGTIIAAIPIIVGLIMIVVYYLKFAPIAIEQQMWGLESQIDVILNKYGMTWEDII